MSTPSEPQDSDLLARLRAADPAARIPAAEPSDVDHLLGRVVNSDLRETGTRRRNALTWLVAAAAGVVIAVGAVWGVQGDAARRGGVPQPATGAPTTPGDVTELTAAPVAGRC